MYRATLDLGRISPTLQLSFITLLNTASDDQLPFNKKGYQTYRRYRNDTGDYLKIKPSSFISLEIVNWNKELNHYDRYDRVSLMQFDQFLLLKHLKSFILKFQDSQIFYYADMNRTRLMVNPEKKNKMAFTINVCGSKTIHMEPAVVEGRTETEWYEGSIFCINDFSHYAYLTYQELEYFHWVIDRINTPLLTMVLLDSIREHQALEYGEEITTFVHTTSAPVNQEPQSGSLVKIENMNTIPDI